MSKSTQTALLDFYDGIRPKLGWVVLGLVFLVPVVISARQGQDPDLEHLKPLDSSVRAGSASEESIPEVLAPGVSGQEPGPVGGYPQGPKVAPKAEDRGEVPVARTPGRSSGSQRRGSAPEQNSEEVIPPAAGIEEDPEESSLPEEDDSSQVSAEDSEQPVKRRPTTPTKPAEQQDTAAGNSAESKETATKNPPATEEPSPVAEEPAPSAKPEID